MLRLIRKQLFRFAMFAAIGAAGLLHAQSVDQEQFVVIHAGRVITMAGPELQDVDILLVDGKIRLVGKDLVYPPSAQQIDARHEVVMPGMICPRTRSGLASYSRSGVHGNWSAAEECYLDEMDFAPFYKAGFTAVGIYPDGTGIPGRAAVYRTAGDTAKRDLGLGYVRVTMSPPERDKTVLRGAIKKAEQEIEKVEKARKDWEEKQKKAKEEAAKKSKEEAAQKKTPTDEKKDADAPTKEGSGAEQEDPKTSVENKEPTFSPPKMDPTVEPLIKWIRDKTGPPLLYELGSASDYVHLQDVLKLAPTRPVSSVYFSNSTRSDIHHVVTQLGEKKTLVLLDTGVGVLPYTTTRYNLAGELTMAGARVALVTRIQTRSSLQEHRLQLAELVRVGLPRDAALKAVTLRCAELLGVDKRIGSIEKGKDGDLMFLDGDPLAPDTHVTRTMTVGEIVWEAR